MVSHTLSSSSGLTLENATVSLCRFGSLATLELKFMPHADLRAVSSTTRSLTSSLVIHSRTAPTFCQPVTHGLSGMSAASRR